MMVTDLVWEPSLPLKYYHFRQAGMKDCRNSVCGFSRNYELRDDSRVLTGLLRACICLSPSSPGEAWYIQGLERVLALSLHPDMGGGWGSVHPAHTTWSAPYWAGSQCDC